MTYLVEGIHWCYTKVGNGKTTYRSDKNIGRAQISVRNVLKVKVFKFMRFFQRNFKKTVG